MAGATAVVVEYGSFYILYLLFGLHLYIAHSVSFLLGLFTSFSINRFWTFYTKSYAKAATHQLGLYIALAATNLIITNLLIGWFNYLGIHPLVGKIFVVTIPPIWNFFLYKTVIFRRRKPETDK